ncbi:hypothetical protein OH77DRAFT_1431533 [Trametes cingulata]|nr:hypothetical protein OH77DRAFT_1431533 [Trametes cingulata]
MGLTLAQRGHAYFFLSERSLVHVSSPFKHTGTQGGWLSIAGCLILRRRDCGRSVISTRIFVNGSNNTELESLSALSSCALLFTSITRMAKTVGTPLPVKPIRSSNVSLRSNLVGSSLALPRPSKAEVLLSILELESVGIPFQISNLRSETTHEAAPVTGQHPAGLP